MKNMIKGLALGVLLSGTASAVYAADCTADAISAGEKGFRACAACHNFDVGKNGVGPNLHAIVGRTIASVDGFKYSNAMADYGKEHGAWTPALLDAYLENPRKVVKGTRMAYPGLRKADKRAEVICYLGSKG